MFGYLFDGVDRLANRCGYMAAAGFIASAVVGCQTAPSERVVMGGQGAGGATAGIDAVELVERVSTADDPVARQAMEIARQIERSSASAAAVGGASVPYEPAVEPIVEQGVVTQPVFEQPGVAGGADVVAYAPQPDSEEVQWLGAAPAAAVSASRGADPVGRGGGLSGPGGVGAGASIAGRDWEEGTRWEGGGGGAVSRQSAAIASGRVNGVGVDTSTPELVRELHDRFMTASMDSPQELRPYMAAAAMSLADPSLELSESDLAALPLGLRRSVLAYQRAFAQLGREMGGESEAGHASSGAELRLAAEEILDQLSADRSLRILNAALCTKVDGYGVYEPFRSTSFLAGLSQPVVIYAELENFSPRAEESGYLVHLTYEVALYNEADGLVVWRRRPSEILDRSRNRRRDFFVVQLVNLPERLTVGKYRLKLTITDRIGGTVDETSLPLEMVADPTLTSVETDRRR